MKDVSKRTHKRLKGRTKLMERRFFLVCLIAIAVFVTNVSFFFILRVVGVITDDGLTIWRISCLVCSLLLS